MLSGIALFLWLEEKQKGEGYYQYLAAVQGSDTRRSAATISVNNGNGTSQAELRDGSVITVKGESVGVGGKVFIQDGEVIGAAPDLAQYEVEV